jgi:hypothetical protein
MLKPLPPDLRRHQDSTIAPIALQAKGSHKEATMTDDEMPRFANDHSVLDKPEQLNKQEQREQREQQSQAMTAARPNRQVAPGRRPLFRI